LKPGARGFFIKLKRRFSMKAIALLSGGLDSTLAIKIVLEQGIDITAVNFFTPFCQCSRKNGCGGNEAKKAADRFGVKLKIFNIGIEYLAMLKHPKHGYGKNLNPCIDCRIFMFRKAREYMQEVGASFVITGEVLGQRPMSQHRRALEIVEEESGLPGLILRPLSAKRLPVSIPEEKGWVNREKLLAISGRSRKPQMAKALDYNISDYPCPAGGCLLTDYGFAQRMRDLMNNSELSLNDIALLKVGRHFRLSPSSKLIVGRNKEENEKLFTLIKEGDIAFRPKQIKGPIGIGRGNLDQDRVNLAAGIIARYSDSFQADKVDIAIEDSSGRNVDSIMADSIAEDKLKLFRV
jgi:tRNA U34 2-thiouridine synthase MnmA/TrmU